MRGKKPAVDGTFYFNELVFCAWRDADFQHKHAAWLEAIHEQIKHGLLVLRVMNGREKNDYVKLFLAQIAPVLANELAARKKLPGCSEKALAAVYSYNSFRALPVGKTAKETGIAADIKKTFAFELRQIKGNQLCWAYGIALLPGKGLVGH